MEALDVFDEKFANIRIDEESKKASVLDIIMIITGKNSGNASNVVKTLPNDLTQEISQLRINGKGRETPVADAKTLVQIIWELPGKAAKAFRRDCANYICRILGGDPTLVKEMEIRVAETSTKEREFFMSGTVVPDEEMLEMADRKMLAKRRLVAEVEEREHAVKRLKIENEEKEQTVKRMNIENMQRLCDFMPDEEMDERDRLMLQDMRRRFLNEQMRGQLTVTNGDVEPMRQEISFPQVARKYGLKYAPQSAGSIGVLMKRLYVARHLVDPPKRRATYQGRPIDENAYWDDDEDIMRAAITMYATNHADAQVTEANELITKLLSVRVDD